MRFAHLADLHLGKRVNDFSMLEDQKYILEQALQLIDGQKAEGVFIAGDIYDKTVPSIEAVLLFDDFLTKLTERNLPVFLVSGNHDCVERVSFGFRLMEKSRVYIAPGYDGRIEKVTVSDPYGELDIYLLPFLKPAHVKAVWREEAEEVVTYQDAVSFVLSHTAIDPARRSILLAHQFVTGAATCDSEERSIGGLDEVSADCFEGFDYVALGHLHGPQKIGKETVRYAGTMLKYSFSEVRHKKSVTMVDIKEKGNVEVMTFPLKPLHDMREIRGSYAEVTKKANYENTDTEDYVRIILTDEEDIFDAVGKLRVIYPNLMKLEYDNIRTRSRQDVRAVKEIKEKKPIELAEELFMLQNNREMDSLQKSYLEEKIRKIWEEKA